tara:strand:- start:262 stop:504 length:243 start_codon:yes stop_codon:yes gene_type:complete
MNLTLDQYDLLIEVMACSLGMCAGAMPVLLWWVWYDRHGKVPQGLKKAQALLDELDNIHPSKPEYLEKLNQVKELQKLWS